MRKLLFVLIASGLFLACSSEEPSNPENAETAPESKATFAELIDCMKQAKELEDPNNCLNRFVSVVENLSVEEADQLSWELYHALLHVGGLKDISDMYTMDTQKESKKVEAIGLLVDAEEGMPFYCINWSYISTKLSDKVSPATKSFLEYRSVHFDKISYDAGLAIGFDELAKRLKDAENVLAQGNSPFREYLVDEISYETSWFINGLDNTPSYDWETKLLYDEARTAGEWLIKNGGPVISKVIEEYHGFIGEQNDRHSDDVWEKFSSEIIRKRLEVHYSIPTGKQ
jgi:hypothetical protein